MPALVRLSDGRILGLVPADFVPRPGTRVADDAEAEGLEWAWVPGEPPSPPPPPRTSTPREFMDRLPMQRQAEITAAAMQSPAVLLWLIRLAGAQEVDVDHPETVAAVDAMRAAGLVTAAEADALLLRGA